MLCRDAVTTTLLPLMLRACDSSNTKTQEEVLKNLAKDALDLPYQVDILQSRSQATSSAWVSS